MIEYANPVLSVVVTIVSDTMRPGTEQLRPCLQALGWQIDPPAMEIIVPHTQYLQSAEKLKCEFPHVRFLEFTDLERYTRHPGNREHHNQLRARGIAAARGELVALTDDCTLPERHWCSRIVEAHQAPIAGAGGTIERGRGGLLSSALYYCEFGRYQSPLREGETLIVSDANACYKRSALQLIRPVWQETFEEMTANPALKAVGHRVVFFPGIIVRENRLHIDLRTALSERFIFGRSYGTRRALRGPVRWIWAALCLALPFLILGRLTRTAFSKGSDIPGFCRTLPATSLLVVAWCLGEMTAYLTGARIERMPQRIEDTSVGTPGHDYSLSVVLAVVDDGVKGSSTAGIERALNALRSQSVTRRFEIICPMTGAAAIEQLQSGYPEVSFLRVDVFSPPGSSERVEELRAAGVAAASGEIVALIEDHVCPDPDWAGEILKAHGAGYAAIGGAIENALDRPLNWAAYFADLGRYHNPLPSGPSAYASLVNVSYKRDRLNVIRGVWSRRFHEMEVHAALMACGEKLALSPAIVVRQIRPEVRFRSSLRDFHTWGRSYGAKRARLSGKSMRIAYACLSPAVPAILLLRSGLDAARKRRLRSTWLKALPVSFTLTVAWSAGELTGYIAGEASPSQPPTDPEIPSGQTIAQISSRDPGNG